MAIAQILVLARHATPAVDVSVHPSEWILTQEGAHAAARLGEAWRELDLDLIVSSTERKAADTGRIAAEVLGTMFQTGHDLHEHERPYIADRTAFEEQMATFFRDEAASRKVERRFTSALDALVKAHAGRRLAVVAHGTVLSLHLAARYGLDAATTWSRLRMPSYVVVDRSTRTVVDVLLDI